MNTGALNIHLHQLSVGQGAAKRMLLRNFRLSCSATNTNNDAMADSANCITTVMGASGCGKSSLLAAIAGLPLGGLDAKIEVELGGQRVDHLPTSQRRIGFLFQEDMLFAHMSVRQNLLFAVPPGSALKRAAVVDQALLELGFSSMADRSPLTLSGGQRARVSLMRTLLAKPQALLLDEPFSKLDATLREQIRQFIFAHVRRLQLPTILVTHDAADIADPRAVIDLDRFISA